MYFKTQLAQSVWESKYRYNNETEDQTIERMVKYISKIEKGYIQYYKDKDLIHKLIFPQYKTYRSFEKKLSLEKTKKPYE